MKTTGKNLLKKLHAYNRKFSVIDSRFLLSYLCFSESYEIFTEVARFYLSAEETTQELADAIEDFKQIQYQVFEKIQTAMTISKTGQSNRLNFLVTFLYFYYFDMKYGGVTEWDKPKYKRALEAYLELSKNKLLHPCDKETIQDFDTKHLNYISKGLSA